MKKILLTFAGFIVTLLSIAQSPNLMNYQGVARNAVGNVLPNQSIALRLSILSGSPTGPVVYSETRALVTNAFGLFNVVVGSAGATNVVGTIAGVNWTAFGAGSGSKYLQVEIDPVGGSSFVNVGSTQLVSVPYALNAGAAAPVGPAGGDLSGTYPNPTVRGLQGRAVSAAAPANKNLLMWDAGTVSWIPATAAQAGIVSGTGTLNTVAKWTPDGVTIGNSKIFDDGTFVGIGTTTPGAGLVVSGNGIWNSAIGIQNTGTGMEWRMNVSGNTFGITKIPGTTFTPLQLFSTGGMDFSNSAGTSIARLLDNGDVGIGTTTPVDKFHVVKNNTGVLVGGGATTGSEVKFLNAGTSNMSIYNRGNNALTFAQTTAVNPTNTPGAELMTLTSAGNLGIGTITPGARLHSVTAAGTNILAENSGTGDAVVGSNTGTSGRGGFFQVTNASNVSDAIRAETNGSGASWAIRAISTGTNGAGLFQQTNAAATNNNIQSNQAGLGRAGLFSATNAASTANALEATTNGSGSAVVGIKTATTGTNAAVSGTNASTDGNAVAVQGVITSTTPGGFSAAVRGINNGTGGLGIGVWGSHAGSGWGVYGTADGGIGVNGSASSGIAVNGASNTGTGGRFTTTSGLALHTTGGVRLQGIGEAANKILTSDATGNATWQTAAAAGVVTGSGTVNFLPKWTPTGTNLGNSLLFDDGTNVGIGTNTPTHRLTVSHGGSTGISVSSTAGFSVIDINAQNGDAALRFGNNGTNQWNFRNQPGTNNLEWFELGGGGSRMILQDATGNLGVGQTTPAYRLDVQHGGATGIRSQSTGTFSVVDIDAANGDAALRFQKAGAGQWNTRNRPADDYYEIFELGGGGSRLVIQDATGNVGIGETNNPTYKLDVLHGGATGIRSRSSGTFSVIDIDAANGDAALRFQKAGVNQWNIRNRPADDYLEIFELGGGGSRMVIQDGSGNVGIGETTNPTYKLDVLHGGATGIRSRSSGTFSVIDIDAANGDAALRFQKAGVNQWNTRNRPADDYYEIFELGGGGSRFVIQDGSGNVGIGETTNPTYKLDVLHGGATGIRSRSSGTFSVIDIDGANGDAALRFQKAGVNQWNVRNRPADDYFEIFELGGGGSRVVIQDGSGNVGIGETTNPTYKLDVLHGGATGIRSRSSGTFSLMDIDGANGDAALRFAKAGVNQWNIRNNPATDDLQIFELGGGGERMRIENTTGNVVVNGNLSKGGGSFKIDHPLDPANKYLYHSFVESPDMMNIYNGNITTDATGKAIVKLPDYFEALNMEFRYQLTVIGSFAQAIVNKEVTNNSFEIATNQPNVKVSWQVTGVRHDAYANKNRIPNEVEKAPQDKGKYLHPKAFNLPATKAIGFNENELKEGASSISDVKPVADKKAVPPTTGGSLDQQTISAPNAGKVDNSGSVSDVAPAKPSDKKLELNGSILDTPAAKPADKKLTNDGSVAPDTKKQEVKPVAKPVEGSIKG